MHFVGFFRRSLVGGLIDRRLAVQVAGVAGILVFAVLSFSWHGWLR